MRNAVVVFLFFVISLTEASAQTTEVLGGHPLCDANSDIQKGIYRLMNGIAGEQRDVCWMRIASCQPFSTTDRLITNARELNRLLFVSDLVPVDGNVLVVKEVAISTGPEARNVQLYRPGIDTRCGRILDPNRKKREVLGRLSDTGEPSAEDDATVSVSDYVNYHRPRTGSPRALNDFHFYYRREAGKQCVGTDDIASGNRAYYDLPQLRPDIPSDPGSALVAYVGSKLGEPFITSAVAQVDKERYSFLRVRNYPMSRLEMPGGMSYFYRDFRVRTPKTTSEVDYVWMVDLESRDERSRSLRTTSCEIRLEIPGG